MFAGGGHGRDEFEWGGEFGDFADGNGRKEEEEERRRRERKVFAVFEEEDGEKRGEDEERRKTGHCLSCGRPLHFCSFFWFYLFFVGVCK